MYLPSHPSSEEFEPASTVQAKVLVGKYRGASVSFILI